MGHKYVSLDHGRQGKTRLFDERGSMSGEICDPRSRKSDKSQRFDERGSIRMFDE